MPDHAIRLTGGEYRGRSISIPKHANLRPSLGKIRQALFNTLQNHTEGARVLELFAGSGALGFEALSRGAGHVTFVDLHKDAVVTIRKNAELLKCSDRATIEHGDALRFEPKTPFDLILADPPYEQGFELKLLEKIQTHWLAPGGILVLESSAHDPALPETVRFLQKTRDREYGDTRLTHYTWV